MYIMDGIVYAGEPTESLEITKVKPLDDMIMLITFSNGETKLFDATILTGPVYEPLKDDKIFKNPVIEYGVITWNNGNIDCSPGKINRPQIWSIYLSGSVYLPVAN